MNLIREGDHFDVVIIGCGITGITAGMLLATAGKKVAILENARMFERESLHTTAHVTEILDARYSQIRVNFGDEKARQVVLSKRKAISLIKEFIASYSIQCQSEIVPGFLFSESAPKRDRLDFQRELSALNVVSIPAHLRQSAPLPFKNRLAIEIENQMSFNPGAYLSQLATEFMTLGGKIYEHTRVLDVTDGEPCHIDTEEGSLTAAKVFVAANIPVTNWLFLNTKISAYRSYALAARVKNSPLPGIYWDTEDPYHYLRTYRTPEQQDLLIVGGEDHKTGTKTNTEECFKNLEAYVRERFEVEEITHRWSGQIIEPVDGLPYIGLNSFSKHVYVSTGYSGNGITFGTLGAMIVSDLILGIKNDYASLYEATRIHPLASMGKFISENKDTVSYFFGDRFSANTSTSEEDLKAGEGKIITSLGKKVAVFKREDGRVFALSAVCPHMGGIVHWNNAEQSWDCPCHGSRFSAEGKVCNGPAHSDLESADTYDEPLDTLSLQIHPDAI